MTSIAAELARWATDLEPTEADLEVAQRRPDSDADRPARGENPIHLGVMMIMNREIGMVTPPLSRNLFMASDLSGKSVLQVAKIAIAIALVVLAALALATCLPFISLTLLGDG